MSSAAFRSNGYPATRWTAVLPLLVALLPAGCKVLERETLFESKSDGELKHLPVTDAWMTPGTPSSTRVQPTGGRTDSASTHSEPGVGEHRPDPGKESVRPQAVRPESRPSQPETSTQNQGPAKVSEPNVPEPAPRRTDREPVRQPDREPTRQAVAPPRPVERYNVQVGDRLELLYTQVFRSEVEYRLLAGDRIRVENLQAPGAAEPAVLQAAAIDRTVIIQPDGKVSLPYIGMVPAAGITIPELTTLLQQRYDEFYVDPQILVTLVRTGAEVADLRESIRSAGSRLVVVAPDGTINVPQLGFVQAAGLSLSELQTELNERYRRASPGLAVTARLARIGYLPLR